MSKEIQSNVKEEHGIYAPSQGVASFNVDCQKGFTPLCPDELPVPRGDEIVNEVLETMAYADYRIASGDEHPENALYFADPKHPQFSPAPEGKDMDIMWNRHCVMYTEGAKLLDGLPNKNDYDLYIGKGTQIGKHVYGALFYDLGNTESTGAIEFLKKKSVGVVCVVGLATDYCVKTTSLQLKKAGFKVILNLGGCRGIAEDTTQKAIEEMTKEGIVIVNNAKEIKEVL